MSSSVQVTHKLIFCWTTFSSDYGTDLWVTNECHSVSSLSRVTFILSDDERVRQLLKGFSSTSQILSMRLRSGLCGGQSEIVPWTIFSQSEPNGILVFPSFNMLVTSGNKPTLVIRYIQKSDDLTKSLNDLWSQSLELMFQHHPSRF